MQDICHYICVGIFKRVFRVVLFYFPLVYRLCTTGPSPWQADVSVVGPVHWSWCSSMVIYIRIISVLNCQFVFNQIDFLSVQTLVFIV